MAADQTDKASFFTDKEKEAIEIFSGNLGGCLYDWIQILRGRELRNYTFDDYDKHRRDFVITTTDFGESIIQFVEQINDR